jgi:hypothetical protein
MCLLISCFLALIIVVLAWLAVGLQKTVDVKTEDARQLRRQLQDCNNQRLRDSIQEKAAAWRRDRRASDKPWGMVVTHEDD